MSPSKSTVQRTNKLSAEMSPSRSTTSERGSIGLSRTKAFDTKMKRTKPARRTSITIAGSVTVPVAEGWTFLEVPVKPNDNGIGLILEVGSNNVVAEVCPFGGASMYNADIRVGDEIAMVRPAGTDKLSNVMCGSRPLTEIFQTLARPAAEAKQTRTRSFTRLGGPPRSSSFTRARRVAKGVHCVAEDGWILTLGRGPNAPPRAPPQAATIATMSGHL